MKTRREMSEAALAYLLVGPALLLIIGLGVYPVYRTIQWSFHDLNIMKNAQVWVGMDHYVALFSDAKFFGAMGVTLGFAAVSVCLQLALGMAIAFLLNRPFAGRRAVRAMVLIPWTLPTIVNASLWGWIYNASYGALNRLLGNWGLEPVIWLGEAGRALGAIILADTWRMTPLTVLMLLAGLQTIPGTSLEAATIEGAGPWQLFCRIYLPLLRPMIKVVLVLRTMQTLRVFDIIYQLTQGGPAGGTATISFFAYHQVFKYLNFGYGSAIAVVIALLTVVISVCHIYALRDEET